MPPIIQERAQTSRGVLETAPRFLGNQPTGISWDFSRIPLYPSSAPAKRLPGFIQRKLKVGAIDDPLEHEADRVADQVMRMPASDAVTVSSRPQVSRKCDRFPFAAGTAESPHSASSVPDGFIGDLGPGHPMDPATRRFFEPRFGRDLGDVRLHTSAAAAQAASAVHAQAFTVGSHVAFAADYGGVHTDGGKRLLAHEIAHVVQQSSTRRTVPLVSRAPVPPLHQPAQASPPAPAVSRGSEARVVDAAIGLVFDNQKTGLTRLKDALHKKAEEVSVIAQLAAVAVSTAIGVLLTPVGGLAAEELIAAGDEAGRRLTEKIAEQLIDKAKEHVAKRTEEWVEEGHRESDPIDNFIEAQDLAINTAKSDALAEFAKHDSEFDASPSGLAASRQLTKAFRERAKLATSVQIALSAGAWARRVTAEQRERIIRVPDTRAWVNNDHESYSEQGALEIDTRVEKAPLSNSADIKIVDSNWRGINKETERVVQEHGGAKIGHLGADLRITVETPVGSTRCHYVVNHPEDPLIPENTIGQSVWVWLVSGKQKPSPGLEDRAAVTSAAAVFGYYVSEKSTRELRFD
ncbi:eCIS core domain-containing protein [Streptomyces sp. CA-106131]|uniref:eCIS core domain-containing protein n=1 Tax=Streptomyces sp. CA-106131 TaxID=3240045 RepID=UPI003D932967